MASDMESVEDRSGRSEPDRIDLAIEAALAHLRDSQTSDGSWKGDYGGPLFLLPMLVASQYIIRHPFEPETKAGIIRYLYRHQNDDGGWGLHVEGDSQLFTTVLCYVALRLLDEPAQQVELSRAREWIISQGGATQSPLWGKFQLALLNLYDYAGLPCLPPELWLLPKSLPVHPSRYWCHSRMVILPMTYLYGKRRQISADERIRELREEIFAEPFEAIDWPSHRYSISPTDEYTPVARTQQLANGMLSLLEPLFSATTRKFALRHVLNHVRQEDDNTSYICIGPINKLLNMLCWYFADPNGPELRRHVQRLGDYLWDGPDGVLMNGYNSSQLWDTAFAVQAVCATGRSDERRDLIEQAYGYLDANQVLEDTVDYRRFYRHPSRGGWPFSTREHGWPISDCTAEAVKACLAVEGQVEQPISDSRLQQAVEWILSMQNRDGGWASYEPTRGPRWLERLNATGLFADIMIDYSYVECTSSCLQALAQFEQRCSPKMRQAVHRSIQRGREFLLQTQRPDGSWVGSWGICFTYGTWFGVWGLVAAGVATEHAAIQRACAFLKSKQLDDGGWGETPESCRQQEYVHAEQGQAVMTAWALLALLRGGHANSEAVRRGTRFLVERQLPDGTWPPEHIAGVFNRTCAIHYDAYLKIFPLWALALCRDVDFKSKETS